jgi:cell volume regulation protein A
MIGMIEFATSDNGTMWTIVREFVLEMSIGLVVGVAGAYGLLLALRLLPLPAEGLYPLLTLAAAGVVYGLASTVHGSGFLAVFVAGILVGDERTPYKEEVESFFTSLASLAEIVMFVALGLTIDFTDLPASAWSDGVVLAVVVALVARPLVVLTLLLPTRLRLGERLFVAWGGLKGAVPIFLAAFAILAGVDDAHRIYGIVFVVASLRAASARDARAAPSAARRAARATPPTRARARRCRPDRRARTAPSASRRRWSSPCRDPRA